MHVIANVRSFTLLGSGGFDDFKVKDANIRSEPYFTNINWTQIFIPHANDIDSVWVVPNLDPWQLNQNYWFGMTQLYANKA